MIPPKMPEIAMNSCPSTSSTLLINSTCARIRMAEKATRTIFLRDDLFVWHLMRPKMETTEKKSPTSVDIEYGFSIGMDSNFTKAPLFASRGYLKIGREPLPYNRKIAWYFFHVRGEITYMLPPSEPG
jgi:hypothetical protein